MQLDYSVTLPLILTASLGILVLISEIVFKKSEPASYWISVLGLAGIGVVLFPGMEPVTGLPAVAGLGGLFCAVFLAAALLTVIFSRDYLRRTGTVQGEYYILIIFSVAGMMMMALATDLLILFVGLELMSVCLYVLAGYLRTRLQGNEASLKYFLLGAFITGFILYGIALVYGTTGSLAIDSLVERMRTPGQPALFWAGVVLLLAGFGFKVGAFPFHMWIPDVYQGAPTPVTAFMATGAKTAAFSVIVMVFARRGAADTDLLRDLVAFLAAGSMIVGNILALTQQNVKRMLAYSSIAHAGYMLAGIAAGNATGRDGVVFYLVSYLFMNIGALGVVSILEEREEKKLSYDDYAGLSGKSPLLAALMAVFLFSLAGLPPFGGFFGKYFVFVAAIESGLTWLAILGVLASLAGVYYYLRLVMVMYFQENERPAPSSVPALALIALVGAGLINLQLGVLPSSIISLIHNLR
jgi:NADH-quinone oxidoreductase subunit N